VLEPAVDAAVVAERVAQGLADNVQAELTAVREAITAAEVRAVAAEARNDALMTEKSRLEAQLKRAEADIEYWRSQHDRLDKDLDREQAHRTASDKAKAVAESETRDARQRVAELTVDLTDTQLRERVLIASEASLSAELDQASMAMGWWSRRRLAKLQARSSPRPASPVVGE
jgi:chromosome segregation ATPase